MKIDKVFARFGANPDSGQELKRVARSLAHELPRQRVEVLRGFRTRLSEQEVPEATFSGGYVAAMLDLTAEYEVVAARARDRYDARQLASQVDHRQILLALARGPARPHELAEQVGLDMGTVVCALEELCDAELARRYPTADEALRQNDPAASPSSPSSSSQWSRGRSHSGARAPTQRDVFGSPYRLTVEGEQVAHELGCSLPEGFELGVALAVEMFSHLLRHAVIPAAAMAEAAQAVLGDRAPIGLAVETWVRAATDAGLLSQTDASGADAPLRDPSALWPRIPGLFSQLARHKRDHAPVYVRSGHAWNAWESALMTERVPYPVLNGDALARGSVPTDKPFELLYDHPAQIGADLRVPGMHRAIEHADRRFVIASSRDTIPDGFVPLDLPTDD